MNSPAQAVKTGHKSTKYAQDGDDAPCVPFTAHLFISEENEAKLVFKAGQRTLDRAALRYSPPSLRGAADDPSLRNQLQQLFLSEDADRPSNWALKSRDNSCSSPPLTLQTHTPQRKLSAAAVKYLFTIYLHNPLSAMLNTHITSPT